MQFIIFNKMSYEGLGGGIGSYKFSDQDTRKDFVKKVYGILGLQLLITFGMTLLPVYHEKTRLWMIHHEWLTIVSAVVLIMVCCTMICVVQLTRTVPVNYALLFLFTLCESYLIADLASRTYPSSAVT